MDDQLLEFANYYEQVFAGHFRRTIADSGLALSQYCQAQCLLVGHPIPDKTQFSRIKISLLFPSLSFLNVS